MKALLRKVLYCFVILSTLVALLPHPLSAWATPAAAMSDLPPRVVPPNPSDRVQAFLGDDPQTQIVQAALAGPFGTGGPSRLEPLSAAGATTAPAVPSAPIPADPRAASPWSSFLLPQPGASAGASTWPDAPSSPIAPAGLGWPASADILSPARDLPPTPRAPGDTGQPAGPPSPASLSAGHPARSSEHGNYQAYLPTILRNYATDAIYPVGGVYVSADSGVTLEFPPQAVAEATRIDLAREAVPQHAIPGAFTIAGHTLTGQPTTLNRPVTIRVTVPAAPDGQAVALNWWDEGRLRWVSVGAHDVPTTDGQVVVTAAVNSFGTYAVTPLDDDPDEGDDGLVITRVCWKPDTDLQYTIVKAELYTTTEEADPWAWLEVSWEYPSGTLHYDDYFWADRDFSLEPLVTMTMETAGPYTVGQVFSYTVYADDLFSNTYRYDWDEGSFQQGTQGCVQGGGGCERIPPVIQYVDIWQSGTGFSIVKAAVTDNAGDPAVELIFNGQTIAMTPMGGGIFEARVDYPPIGSNSYQVTASDACGNYTTFPGNGPIVASASASGSYGWAPFKNSCGGYCGTEGDPVNTANGNFSYRTTDASVVGLGDTTLNLERAVNSMAALWPSASVMRFTDDGNGGANEDMVAGPPQYFGPGWTFPYGTYLLVVDEPPFYQGAQIQYADGRTVLFTQNPDGSYRPDAPGSFDRLVREGGGFALYHSRTLQVERFDAAGHLVAIEDHNGNAISLYYTGDRLTRLENASGRWLEFSYDGAGLITAAAMPESVTLNYEYTDGLLTGFINGRGLRTGYQYNGDEMLTSIVTPQGHPELRLQYDPNDFRVTEQIVGATEEHTFAYSEDGTATTMRDAYGTPTVHHYDGQGRLVQIDYGDGTSEAFGYDDDFNRTYYRDQAGHEWSWSYDDHGNRLTEDGPLGWHREWSYNELDLPTRLLEQVDAGTTRETAYTYDDRGNMTEVCNPLHDCSTFTYDGRGLPTDSYDFAHNHTTNVYNGVGDLEAATDAEGETTRFRYDGLGRMVERQTPLGYSYSYTYDPNGNLTAVDGPLGYHLGYRFDDNDNLEAEIDPNGGETGYGHDASENQASVTGTLGFVTGYTYGLMNELTGFQDAEGRTWTYEYDALLRLTDIYGPLDTHTHYDYDAVGNVVDTTDPLGYVTHSEYDALSRPVAVTRNYRPGEPASADTNVITAFAYDLLGNVLRTVDPEGNATAFEYDLVGQMTLKRDAENQEWAYEYEPMGHVTSTTNPRGYPTVYEYDRAYRLHATTDAKGNTTTFLYDKDGKLADAIDPLGVVTHYINDELDRPVREVRNYRPGEPGDAQTNVTTAYEYDPAGRLRFVTEPRGYRSETRYDAAGRLTDRFDYEGAHTCFTYDRVDNLLTITDDNEHTTSYTYDALDHRVTESNPEGHTVYLSYDKVGHLTDVQDANGNPAHYDLDAMGRTTLMVDALGGEWSYTYDRAGNLLVEVDANGHPTSYTYDKVYRMLSSADAEGYTVRSEWDGNSNLVEFVDGNGYSSLYTYDEVDRLSAFTNAEGEVTGYSYDPLGNQTRLIEADGAVTRYDYDPLYRLVAVTENYEEPGPRNNDTNVLTRYTYDASSNLAQAINANGAATAFTHDGMGRLLGEVDALGHSWEYTYDGAGNRVSRRDANGAWTSYAYYPDDQLRRVDYTHGMQVEYSYDRNNNRTAMLDHLGTTTWIYDALNRVTDTADPFQRALHYRYDPVGNRVEMTYADGNRVGYTYYDNDWMKTAVDAAGNITAYLYDGVGNIIRIVNPNSTVTDVTYDRVDRVLTLANRQVVGGQETNSAFAYSYNDLGHVVQVVSEYGWRNPAVITETYGYDGLHRLAGMQDSEGVVMAYGYDNVGNRLNWTTNDDQTTQTPGDGFTASYVYNAANQLTKATIDSVTPNGDLVVQLAYDKNGNRIGKLATPASGPADGADYLYDPENRLVVAQDYQLVDHGNRVDRAITTMAYDGGGRQLVQSYDPKTGGGGEKRVEYVLDGRDPVAEYDMLNGQRDNYYRGALGRIMTMHHFPAGAEGQMYWYHYNSKGDVVGLTKQGGQSTHNYRYDPYGIVLPAHGNFTDPHNHYTLTGKEYDENTGLVYFGERNYDASLAVWQTQDAFRGMLSSPRSLHRYGYVYGNPISYYDAYGNWPDFLDKAVESVGNWVDDHKEEIVRGVAIGAAVVAATAITVATAGAGAPAAVIIVGAVVAGTGAAAIGTVGANVALEREWNEDLGENALIGATIGLGIGSVGAVAGASTLAWGSQVVGSNASAIASYLGASSTTASFLGSASALLVPSGMIAGAGMFFGGVACSLNPFLSDEARQACGATAGAGTVLSTGSYAIGETINYFGAYAKQCSLYTNPDQVARSRAEALQQALPPKSQGRVTMGAGVVEDAGGTRQVVIGTSEPNGYLRPGMREALEPGEIVASGTGHAEVNIVNWATSNGQQVISVGAGRPVCANCCSVINSSGGTIATPIKK